MQTILRSGEIFFLNNILSIGATELEKGKWGITATLTDSSMVVLTHDELEFLEAHELLSKINTEICKGNRLVFESDEYYSVDAEGCGCILYQRGKAEESIIQHSDH